MTKKLEIPNLDDESKFKSYASKYTVDDLLDIFSMIKWDKEKEESVKKILRMKTNKEHGIINLDSLLLDFNQSDYKKTLLKVGDSTPEFTFTNEILEYIEKIIIWVELENKEKFFLEKIWIDIKDKDLLKDLKKELELYITSFYESKGIQVPNDYFELRTKKILQDKRREIHEWNTKRKTMMTGHWAFNDGSWWSEEFCPVVVYKVWDEYIPISNNCVWEIWKIDPNKNPDPTFDMFWAYSNWDRFTVVRPTYSEDIKYDRKKIKCWFVNVRSKKTWKVYRVLSR